MARSLKLFKTARQPFSTSPILRDTQAPSDYKKLQFSKERLVDFGELPIGEIPDALEYSPLFSRTTLNNDASVNTEKYLGQGTCVSLFVKAGSRFEDLACTGTANILLHLWLNGTKKKSKQQLEAALYALGGQLKYHIDREVLGLSLFVEKKDVQSAIDLLCEMVLETDLSQEAFQTVLPNATKKSKEISRDQHWFIQENMYYASYPDSMIGQPTYGNRDLIGNMTLEHVNKHIRRTYVGKAFSVVVTGDVEHEPVATASAKWLNPIPSDPREELILESTNTAYFSPNITVMYDSDLAYMNLGYAYAGPSTRSPLFFAGQLWREIFGDFDCNWDGLGNNSHWKKQYNMSHLYWAYNPGVMIVKPELCSLADSGMFTFWMHMHPLLSNLGLYLLPGAVSKQTMNLTHTECMRARAKIFNRLLEDYPSQELNYQIAKNGFDLGRRISRTEYATRVSWMSETKFLRDVGRKYFHDRDYTMVLWGEAHGNLVRLLYDWDHFLA